MFIADNQELSPMQPDTNATEPDSPRTWAVSSVIQIPTARERHGEKLKCVALHESYAAKSVAVEAKMDVKCEYIAKIINHILQRYESHAFGCYHSGMDGSQQNEEYFFV